MLEISLDQNQRSFTPGSKITGHVRWELDSPAKSIELRFFWHTSGKGKVDISVISRKDFTNTLSSSYGTFEFMFPDSPYSFNGRLVSVAWALELVVEPGKQTKYLELTMSPTGQALPLESIRI